MSVQYLEIDGRTMAVLPKSDYDHLVEMVEAKAEVLAAMQAEQRRLAGEEYLPAEMVDRLLAGENALRVWRKHRKMTLAELGAIVGAAQSYLSEIETGQRQGKPALWRKLATALNVDMEDIVPNASQ